MPEQKFALIPYLVTYKCDGCLEEMTFTGGVNGEGKYQHQCKNGHVQDLDAEYPSTRYKKGNPLK